MGVLPSQHRSVLSSVELALARTRRCERSTAPLPLWMIGGLRLSRHSSLHRGALFLVPLQDLDHFGVSSLRGPVEWGLATVVARIRHSSCFQQHLHTVKGSAPSCHMKSRQAFTGLLRYVGAT